MNLKNLNLDNNFIRDVGSLGTFKNLKSFSIKNNPISTKL